jgi:iron(III) transport system substrate-binding protein
MSHSLVPKVFNRVRLIVALFGCILLATLAEAQPKRPVVIYTSLDRQFSEPILTEYTRRTGIPVRPVYDTEAVKTVGLINRLLAERNAPRCDVFWNNEIVRSIQLKNEGLTAPYRSPSAESIPDSLKDPDGHWTGFAARARVLMTNKTALGDRPAPRSASELLDPQWKGQATFAKPLFGTTNTHAAVMWSTMGEAKFKEFWTGALENNMMLAGNAQARDAAAAGRAVWCWTDTDDAYGAIVDGAPVEMIYPESDPAGGQGTLLIPNTVVLIANSPNPEGGKALIDFILSEEVEGLLAKSRSAQIPVRKSVAPPPGIAPLKPEQILAVDWQKAYESVAPASQWLQEFLATK